MIIWLHEKLYDFVKNNPTYLDIEQRTKEVWGNGDLSTFHSIFTPEGRTAYTQARIDYYNFFANLEMPEDLKIRWQISTITDWFNRDNNLRDDEDYPIGVWMQEQMSNPQAQNNTLSVFTNPNLYTTDDFVQLMNTKIDALPAGNDQISCRIYLIVHKITDMIESQGVSFYHQDILTLRQQVLDLYELDPAHNYEPEVHMLAYACKAALWFGNNMDANRTFEEITVLYDSLLNTLQTYETSALSVHDTDYMRNNLAHAKIDLHRNFYSNFVHNFYESPPPRLTELTMDQPSFGSPRFAELDDLILTKYNDIIFKYKDFNYHSLKYFFDRFNANMGHDEYNRAIIILQNIYDLVVLNLQDKNLMGRKMNYLATSYHTAFFAFIAGMRRLEAELLNDLNTYQNKNQWANLAFSENEERLIASDWCGDENLTSVAINYAWLRSKLKG